MQVVYIQRGTLDLQFQIRNLIEILFQIKGQRGFQGCSEIKTGFVGLYHCIKRNLARHAIGNSSGLQVEVFQQELRAAAFIAIAGLRFFNLDAGDVKFYRHCSLLFCYWRSLLFAVLLAEQIVQISAAILELHYIDLDAAHAHLAHHHLF